MHDLTHLYQQAGELHGELCAGIILGVRMAVLGCAAINIPEPRAPQSRPNLVVWVEIARCATDGIQTVTGCSLGKRTLVLVDYGVLAATFLNLDTSEAVRVSVHPEARTKAKKLFPLRHDLKQVYLEGYRQLPDQELFIVERVRVIPPRRSGDPSASKHVVCTHCGEEVLRGREIMEGDRCLCHRCAGLPLYYQPLAPEP